MKYAFFVGCTTLARLWPYESSTRKVAEHLDIELMDMPGSSCCGTTYLEALDHITGLAIAARNICIAEEMGTDIVTICNGCRLGSNAILHSHVILYPDVCTGDDVVFSYPPVR